jgi:hypothetical protein
LNRIFPPKLHRSTNKHFYFTPTESQTGVRLAGEALKSLPNVTPRAKRPTRAWLQAVSETGYLVLVYQCWRRLVKSFFYGESGFSMAIVWGAKS